MTAPDANHDLSEFLLNSSRLYRGECDMAAVPVADIGSADRRYRRSRRPGQVYMFISTLDSVLNFANTEFVSRLMVDNSERFAFPLDDASRCRMSDMLMRTWRAYERAGYTAADFADCPLASVLLAVVIYEERRDAAIAELRQLLD